MKQAFTFPDAQLAVVTLLRAKLDTLAVGEGATVGTKLPSDKSLDKPSLPYVMVRLDGSTLDKYIDEEATIRISVWHKTEALGLALAQAARAVLLAYEGGSEIRVIKPLTGAIPTSDPESGESLTSFTLAVKLRPIPLS